ncbi:MAG: hypothetical protein Q8Q62_10710 [Mesorhizobium sp.]|nr:hypothetical protein [Mesorhizobium sp.]
MNRIGKSLLRAAMLAAVALASPPAGAETCPICARSVVTNSDLATCFLEKYGEAAGSGGGAVAVDLTRCERSRSIVQALPGPAVPVEEPDTKFLLSRGQIECLRRKLEEPGLVLDPQARIDLGGC